MMIGDELIAGTGTDTGTDTGKCSTSLAKDQSESNPRDTDQWPVEAIDQSTP